MYTGTVNNDEEFDGIVYMRRILDDTRKWSTYRGDKVHGFQILNGNDYFGINETICKYKLKCTDK